MPRFPFFGFPYQYPYYSKYYNNNYYYQNMKNDIKQSNKNDKETKENLTQDKEDNNRYNTKTSSKNNQLLPFSFNFTGFSDYDKPIIEILGIKLFLDDIIILSILFILYKEGVKDEMLFIALILLLLS